MIHKQDFFLSLMLTFNIHLIYCCVHFELKHRNPNEARNDSWKVFKLQTTKNNHAKQTKDPQMIYALR